MTKQEIVEQRVNNLVAKIEIQKLKWKATIDGSNKQSYVIPECSSKEEFVAALTLIIEEIVDSELSGG